MERRDLQALYILRNNIAGALTARRESQSALARWLRKDKSWINKFLNGTREIQLRDLDRIAQFFGLATYQLFQPGIAPITERRSGRDRRTGHDRRVSRLTQSLHDDRPIRTAIAAAQQREAEIAAERKIPLRPLAERSKRRRITP
jgi:transcriptional regulator with XRE-family HTH domain